MKVHKSILFLFQTVTIGLALAFLLLMWRPDLFGGKEPLRGNKVVEVMQSALPAGTSPAMGPISYAPAVEAAAPAVVNIHTRKMVREQVNPLLQDPFFRRFFGDGGSAPRQRIETSLGSGVIVSAEGYVLTNYHVVAGAEEIAVAFPDGTTAEATLVGTDPEADLAVLKIEVKRKLPVITIGRSENLRVGDVVLAIGNPFGVGQTVTQGIVSATGRSRLGISTFEDFIQTDAAINPGNSGGALINALGELVGINTAIFTRSGGSQGIGFAIPVSIARESMTQIIEKGHVSRGWLGVAIQDLTPELASSFGLKQQRGVVVAGVLESGPAAQADLRPGDVLTTIQEEKITDVRQALDTIAGFAPGSRVSVQGMRQGKVFEKEVTVGQRPVEPVR